MINFLAQITRRLYWLPGNYFIYLLFSKLFNSKIKATEVIVCTPLHYKIKVNPQRYIGNKIFWRGAHEWDIIFILSKLLKKTDIVFDVGANIGEISLHSASLVSQGKVYAFEPVSMIRKELQNNINLNPHLKNITIIHQGLGDKINSLPIYHESTEKYNEGIFSIYPENPLSSECIENIQINTIDNILNEQKINRVNLIKIDVEGHELMVLQGAKNTLLKYKPYLIIEISQKNIETAKYKAEDILFFLNQLGYKNFYIIKTRGKLKPFTSVEELPEFCIILVN